jgi:hypothetical protein
MDFASASWEIYQIIVQFLVYAAILINLVLTKGSARIKFLGIVAGYFFISFYINDFFLASTFITIWFLISGVDFFVSPEILAALVIIMYFLSYSNPIFYLVVIILYSITLTNFLFSSFRMVHIS